MANKTAEQICDEAAAHFVEILSRHKDIVGWVPDEVQAAFASVCDALERTHQPIPDKWRPILQMLVNSGTSAARCGLRLLPQTEAENMLIAILDKPSSGPGWGRIFEVFRTPRLNEELVERGLHQENSRRQLQLMWLELDPSVSDVLARKLEHLGEEWFVNRPRDVHIAVYSQFLNFPVKEGIHWMLVASLHPRIANEELARQMGALADEHLRHAVTEVQALVQQWPPTGLAANSLVALLEAAARLEETPNVVRHVLSCADRWPELTPALRQRLEWLASKEPQALELLRNSQNSSALDRALYGVYESICNGGDVLPDETKKIQEHPAFAWVLVRWGCGPWMYLKHLQQGRCREEVGQAARAWMDHFLINGCETELEPDELRSVISQVGGSGTAQRIAVLARQEALLKDAESTMVHVLLSEAKERVGEVREVLEQLLREGTALSLVSAALLAAPSLISADKVRAAAEKVGKPKGKKKNASAELLAGALAAVEADSERQGLTARQSEEPPTLESAGLMATALPVNVHVPVEWMEVRSGCWLVAGEQRVAVGRDQELLESLEGQSPVGAVLSAEGDQIYLMDESTVTVFSLGPTPPRGERKVLNLSEDGFVGYCALPGHVLVTSFASQSGDHDLHLWDTVRGTVTWKGNSPNGVWACGIAPTSDGRLCIVSDVSVDLLRPGEKKFGKWSAPRKISGVAFGSTWMAVTLEDGGLTFLDVTGAKPKESGFHAGSCVNPRSLHARPGSNWLLQAEPEGLRLWHGGKIAGWLPWPAHKSTDDPCVVALEEDHALVAVGTTVDFWALSTRGRVARWNAPATITMATVAHGTWWLGMQDGQVWRVFLHA